jgi:hypothetical protein
VSEPRLVLELVGESAPPVELPRAGRLTIGSASSRVDLALSGQGVADVHCAIGRVKGGGWALKDLGSNYGTIHNGERVQTAKLAPGDVLVIGSRRLRVVDPDARAAEPPPPPVLPPPPPAPAPKQSAPEPAPRVAAVLPRVEGYRVEKLLGRGGMGQVYLAVQESLQRRVALKVLSEKLSADADFVRRFQAEARAAAALNHPNIVTVHDVWEAGGRHWLAMEYMDHGTLEGRVAADGQVPWREVLDVLCDASKGLVYAELRGIVHRDIKPANLMLNEAGTTKIADLGLATHLEAEATDAGDRKIFGTPHFISPEQARGERVDARSDLYSLGATAYRLLTGHTPFEGATTREILRGHFFETPRPVTERAPDVPPELAAIVLKLLAKKPEERHSSAGALLQELERLRSVVIHGVAARATEAAPARRSRVVPWLALAAVVALAVWFLRPRSEPQKQQADEGAVVDEVPPAQDPLALTEPEPQPAEAAPEPVQDAEDALVRLERDAESAWRAIPAELTPQERRAELERLARAFAGSTWAARFETEAAQLAGSLATTSAADAELELARAGALERLRAASADADGPRTVFEAWPAMLAVEIDPLLLADGAFVERWKGVWREVLGGAAARGRAALEEADRQAERGEFGLVEQGLKQALAHVLAPEIPPLPEELAAACAEELGALSEARAALEERIAGLDLERARFDRALALSERRRIAEGLWRSGELERELRAFDLAAADARVAALEGALDRPDSRGGLAELRAELAAARTAFEPLVREWPAGGWKRRTVNDPRIRGRANREAVNADARGVLVKDGESTELVGWDEFARRPAELHQLFLERLSRPYTASETGAIAALLRLAAVLQAVDEGAEVLADPEHQALSGEESQRLLEGFELAREWSQDPAAKARLEGETAAAALLASALSASSEKRWGEACALLERLLSEQGETLLVRLLSDGRDLAVPAAAPTEGERSPRGG